MINILINHKNKKEFKKDIDEIKKIFDIVEMSDIKEYKKKYYIEIDVIIKRENKIETNSLNSIDKEELTIFKEELNSYVQRLNLNKEDVINILDDIYR